MTKVDQFESVFKAADKPVFSYEPVAFERVLVLSDGDDRQAEEFAAHVRTLLAVLEEGATPDWSVHGGSAFGDVGSLLALIEREKPELVCTYRHLHSNAWRWPYSVGECLDILLQQTTIPVLVMPHPRDDRAPRKTRTGCVMAITDHLAADDDLINLAVRFTASDGTLHLVHVEDQAAFERFIDVISKIPSIDTERAREDISRRLLKEPRDFLVSCREVLEQMGVHCGIEEIIIFGRHLFTVKGLVLQHDADLVVMNTKDEDQLAMRGMAYPLAVQLRNVPLLMI